MFEKYREKFTKIQELGNFYRQGRTFRTQSKRYFIDSGTGKVFSIDNNVYQILECLFKTNDFDNISKLNLSEEELEKSLKIIFDAVDDNHIFSAPKLCRENITGRQVTVLDDLLNNDITSVTLELTEECNLRCRYCLYGDSNTEYRPFGHKQMTFSTAKKAVDFLFKHSRPEAEIYIGFYGGEPLLKFDLIKEVVEYANTIKNDRKLSYSITTNLTLMTHEVAEYLASVPGFSVVVSIDGPEDIHNANRVYHDGCGTFADAIRGLEIYHKLRDKGPNKNEPMICNIVYAKPYSDEKINRINEFFKSLTWYRGEFNASYVSRGSKKSEYIPINEREENNWDDKNTYIYDDLIFWTLKNKWDKNLFTYSYVQSALHSLHQRFLSDMPHLEYTLNGCCVPGARRLYITADGNFLPCERVGTPFYIGNVDNGFFIDKIKEQYVNKFIDEQIKYCGECWAVNLCRNCYTECFGKDEIDFSYRHNLCASTRYRLQEDLMVYHEVLEHSPQRLEALNKIVVK